MDAFDRALEQFQTDGSFIYQDARLSIDHIRALQASFDNLNLNNADQCCFHLRQVRLDPQTSQQTVAPALRKYATRTSHSDSSSQSSSFDDDSSESSVVSRYYSDMSDMAVAKRIECFQGWVQNKEEVSFTVSRDKYSNELLSVLKWGPAWSSIKIEHVYFQEGPEGKHYLSASFHGRLLSYLTGHQSLLRLSLDPFFLSEGSVSLGNFLTKNAYLQELSLGITAGKLLDWENVGLKLAEHRELKQANFKSTVLNNANCSGLLALSANNYQTMILFPRMPDGVALNIELFEAYQALWERLRNTPEERFIQERLSEASLLNLAVRTLIKIKTVQATSYGSALHDAAGPKEKLVEGAVRVVGQLIDASINEAQASERGIESNRSKGSRIHQEKRALKLFAYLIGERDLESIRLSEEECQVLPRVYQANWNYLKHHLSLLKLNLNNHYADRNQSIASFLLDKVYEIRNAEALQLLLNTEVNVFEPVANAQEAFLVKVFKNKNWDTKSLRQSLLRHLIQDDKAMGEIERQLESYPKLMGLYQSLIKHLDRYAGILKQRGEDNLANRLIAALKSGLFFIWKEDTAANRPEEFSEIKYHFEQSISAHYQQW